MVGEESSHVQSKEDLLLLAPHSLIPVCYGYWSFCTPLESLQQNHIFCYIPLHRTHHVASQCPFSNKQPQVGVHHNLGPKQQPPHNPPQKPNPKDHKIPTSSNPTSLHVFRSPTRPTRLPRCRQSDRLPTKLPELHVGVSGVGRGDRHRLVDVALNRHPGCSPGFGTEPASAESPEQCQQKGHGLVAPGCPVKPCVLIIRSLQ